jgi:hypothetical protein
VSALIIIETAKTTTAHQLTGGNKPSMSPTLFPLHPSSSHYHDILLVLSILRCQHENGSSIMHYHVDAQMFQSRSVSSANIIENSAPKVGIARTSNCKSLIGNGCFKCNINRKQEGISIALKYPERKIAYHHGHPM